MNNNKVLFITGANKPVMILIMLLNFAYFSFSQTIDSAKTIYHFSGTASVTNEGISLIPTFSLGKPAAIFVM